jgi:ABC-2 type transport system permease protein
VSAVRRALRAYPTLLRVGFAEVVAYRAEFLVWILTTNMPFVMLAIWHAVAADGAVGRFDQSRFVAYYLGAWVVRLVTSTWIVWEMSMDIRNGALAPRLLRPLHALFSYSAEHLAAVPMRLLVVSPVIVLMGVTAREHLTRDPRLWVVFFLSLIGAWFLIFFTMVLMGSLAFFLESSLGLFDLWLGVHAIFSGYLVPLERLPGWVSRLAVYLPFRSMLAFPVETLVGLEPLPQALRDLGVQAIWAAGTAAMALTMWRRGVKRFVAYGG